MLGGKSVLLLQLFVFACISFDCTINAYVISNNDGTTQIKALKVDAVTACRMSCFDKFLTDRDDSAVNPFWNIVDQCIEQSNCYMCYDFCGMLNDESRMIGKLMCTNDSCVRRICRLKLNDKISKTVSFLFL